MATDRTRQLVAEVGVSAGLLSLWIAVVMHSAMAWLGGTAVGLVAAVAIAISQNRVH